MQDWPPGARFVLGFGQTMMKTMRDYIEEHGDALLDDTDAGNESAIG